MGSWFMEESKKKCSIKWEFVEVGIIDKYTDDNENSDDSDYDDSEKIDNDLLVLFNSASAESDFDSFDV